MLKKYYLPAGLLIAIAAALLYAPPGTSLKQAGIVPWLVAAIFVVNGYRTDLRMFPRNAGFVKVLAAALVIALVAGPFLGLWVGRITGLAAGAALGLAVMAAVPATLSSGIVITEVAGGNTLWALLLTIFVNLAGIFSVPFMLGFTVSGGDGVVIESLPLLVKLLKIVLLPFLAGWVLARLLRRPLHPLLVFLPSTCVILTVWVSLSASQESLLELNPLTIMIMGGAAFLVHGMLMAGALFTGLSLKTAGPELKALVFVSSQKTLPVALSVLTAVGVVSGPAFIICILFHFIQLVTDSLIASRLAQ